MFNRACLVLAALRPRTRADARGFSLIELMVVAGVFALLSTVVLSSNTRFGNKIVLENLASDIALTIREAQVYGIAVRRCDPGTSACGGIQNEYDVAYGVHFTDGGNAFELFVDTNGDAKWQSGETVLANTVAGGYRFKELCVGPIASENCTLSELNVAFRRPEPDACIQGDFDEANDNECISPNGRARIVVESARGDIAEVVVESTGQISVQ